MIDLHAHILPRLDDGPQDLTQALELARCMCDDGIRAAVAAPHMFDGLYNVARADILAGVAQLGAALQRESIPLQLLPGGEAHAQSDLCERVRLGEAMTVADGGTHLIVEFSRDVIPRGMEQTLFDLRLQGITALIAHPERHRAFQEDPRRLLPFVRAGHWIQVTAGSLTGDYGPHAERCACDLVRRRMAHVVATDTHSADRRPPRLRAARAVVERLTGAAETQEIFDARPEAILRGETVALPEPHEPPPSLWRRLFVKARTCGA